MMKRKKKLLPTFLIVLLTIQALSLLPSAHSQSASTKVCVDPQIVLDVPPSENFTISINITDVNLLYGLDLVFRWDPSVLDYVSHVTKIPVEDYPDGVLHEPVLKVKDEVNTTLGEIWIAYASMSPAPPFNGSGIAVEITFQVKDWGISDLNIFASDLADTEGKPISHETCDGIFMNQPPPEAKLMAPIIRNESLTLGTSFDAWISAENLYKLKVFRLWFSYNTSILDVKNITFNPAFTETLANVDEIRGEIYISANTTDSISGTANLIAITFEVTNIGSSTLKIERAELIFWVREQTLHQEYTVQNGLFDNRPPPAGQILISPKKILDPELKPGMNFSIAIKITAIDLYVYQFNLTYDTKILTCIGIIITPPTNETSFHTEIIIKDEDGWAWVNVTYYPPAQPLNLSNDTVALMYFQIQDYGCTPLNLTQTRLVDCYENPISHTVGHGWFGVLTADIAVLWVNAYPSAVYSGKIVNITVILVNEGHFDSTFNLSIYYGENLIHEETLSLLINETITLVIGWNTSDFAPCNNYTIRVEVSQVKYEVDVDDNVYIDGYVKIKMLGDINGDGEINIYDIVEACASYGSKEGDPTYNEEADIAPPYGEIDIYDIVTISAKYSTKC